jgi:hypothetical protein
MELLTGTSLGAWAQGGIDLPRALAVLVQICDGLGAAHQVGVVHRDLKPDNVIVVPTSDGAELVKLLDFGVAKLLNRDDEDVGFQTAAGSVIGTPAYMSPEQAGGMLIDARSDIYSLGAIMYELFCGQPMFRGRSFGEYVRKHLTELPVPPRQTPGGAGLDPQLEAVILKALEKDPGQRFSHIVELREALLRLLGGMETYPTGSGMRPQGTQLLVPPPYTSPHSQLSQHSGPYPPHSPLSAPYSYAPAPAGRAAVPWRAWAVGGGVAVVLGVVTAVWYAGRGAPSPEPPSAAPAAPPTVQPAAQPSEPPAPRAQPFEVQFDSLPSAGVFAAGRSVELCRTPCALNIDPSDGGPTDRRGFVVKRDGYTDGAVTIDLAGSKREFHVTLEPTAAPPAPPAPSPPPPTPVIVTPDVTPDSRAEAKSDAKRPPKRPLKSTKKDGKDGVPGKEPRDAKEAKDARGGELEHLIDPTDGKPAVPKKPPAKPTIDPSDTLDPFQRKK